MNHNMPRKADEKVDDSDMYPRTTATADLSEDWLRVQQDLGSNVREDTTNGSSCSMTRCMRTARAAQPNPTDPLGALQYSTVPMPSIPEGYTRVKMMRSSLNRNDLAVLSGGLELRGYPAGLGCEGVGRLEDGREVLIYPVKVDVEATKDKSRDSTASAPRNAHSSANGSVIENSSTKGSANGTNTNGRIYSGSNGADEIPRHSIHTDTSEHIVGPLVQGLMSEFAVVPTANLVPKPRDLNINSASVLGCAWLTAYRMLFTLSGLKQGERMLVQGSSGGVATGLIQLGRAAGMEVWVTGRTEEKRTLALRHLGADRVFGPYDKLPGQVRAVFNVSSGPEFGQAMESVEEGGSVILCGSHAGDHVKTKLTYILSKTVTIRGCFLGTMDEFKGLIQFVTAHRIHPLIDSVVPLDGVKEGLLRMLAGDIRGKVVVTI